MSNFLADFCGSEDFQLNETWHSETPDFSDCFQETVLVWIPCAFLWITSSYEVFRIYNSDRQALPWTVLNIAKLILSIVMTIVNVIHFIQSLVMFGERYVYPVNYFAPFIKILSFTLSSTLIYYNRKKGNNTSAILFLFWLLTSIAGIVNYYSMFLATYSNGEYNGHTNDLIYALRLISTPISIFQLILSCFSDEKPIENIFKKSEEKKCSINPLSTASILSTLTFWWATKMILLGYKKPLTKHDMWSITKENSTEENARLFEKTIALSDSTKNQRVGEASGNSSVGKKYNGILMPLITTYWMYFIFMAILKFAICFLPYVNPIILDYLIAYMANNEPNWRGYVYAIGMFIAPLIESIVTSQYELGIATIGMRIRSCVTNAIYKKSLKLSSSGRKEFTTGEIVNLMAIDTNRLMEFVLVVNDTWSAPIQIAIGLYLLWAQLGVATLAGFGTMLVLIPINGYITGKMHSLQTDVMRHKDKRIKTLNEILSGVKVLKLYAWETLFMDMVMKMRSKEIAALITRAYFHGLMVAISSFTAYTLIDTTNNILTAGKAFVSLALFNQIRYPLNQLPSLINFYVMFIVSNRRLNKYMSGNELDENSITYDSSIKEPIVIKDASFSWTKEDAVVLKNINLIIEKNKLVAIVGEVGAGKSSILNALLGNMNEVSGSVNINGSIAYVPQQAWIQNATLRKNIIYTNTADEKKLQQVINNCELRPDLDILPGGMFTEIGEKGINLSGGQKQRVSIARAVYSDADIYLFDDPLSALDTHVGSNIFNKVIGANGVLCDKTRVLVTHRISVLSKCDQIIVVNNGMICESGTYKQLLQRNGDFAQFIISHINEAEEDLQVIEQIVRPDTQLSSKIISNIDDIEMQANTITSNLSNKSARDSKDVHKSSIKRAEEINEMKSNSKLTEAEKSEIGSVKWTVYWDYLKRIGIIGGVVVLLSYMCNTAFNIGSSQWLSDWSDDSNNPHLIDDVSKRHMRLAIYGVLGTLEVLCILVAALTLNIICINGSKVLHNDMISRIMRAPISYFDTTPMGRILNRFARDIDVCDSNLNMNIRMTLKMFFLAFGAILVIGIETPYVLLVIIPVGFVYYFIQKLYIATSRQLKRIESTTRSPIYTHFSETLCGATSIRAYGSVNKFIDENNRRVDVNHSCYYPSVVMNRWLAIRLEFLGYTIIFINAMFAVLSRKTLSPGVVGLTMSYAMTITRSLNYLVYALNTLETNIVSVERCLEYTKTPLEAEWYKPNNQPYDEWPDKGVIEFNEYSTRYRDGLQLVLKGISFQVNSGERVGVVGRTGAGKSSLTLSLFRIIEAVCGSIVIDSVDISSLGLYDLRSRLTIIPQDPVLFTGTLRLNLDPFEKYSDEDIWLSLELSHLKQFVSSLEFGLSHEITESGDNLSVGQKQLVCLARALLRKSRIIVLDEATAAVDIETDELIQTTIRTEFNKCTIVTIAHRLNTIIDYDRVLVMDNGMIAEYNSPHILLSDSNSIFYSMAKDAGLL